MNATEMLANVGKCANWHANGLDISVKIVDAKSAYGTLRYKITPLRGSGSVWVNANTLGMVGKVSE